MSDNWDFYFCTVDEKPASIFLDLGIASEAPMRAFPDMAYVRLHIRKPEPNGMPNREESEVLRVIEDSLVADLCLGGKAVYVGRSTCDGCRDLFFYTMPASGWEGRVRQLMSSFSDYEFEAEARNEPDWQTYRDFLYPEDTERQQMWNSRVCESLQRAGDDLTQEREINHWAYFPDSASRDVFIEGAAKMGFTARSTTNPEKEGDSFGVQVSRSDVPSFQGIDHIVRPLFTLAKDAGGDYDGWETEVVT